MCDYPLHSCFKYIVLPYPNYWKVLYLTKESFVKIVTDDKMIILSFTVKFSKHLEIQ
jgi:hypothetical protein